MKQTLTVISALTLLSLTLLTSCVGAGNKAENKQKTDKTMKPIELTKEDFLKKVVDYEANPTEWKYLGDRPAIVDFYASWCGPCKMLAPILDELAQEYADSLYIYKVNTEKEQEIAAAFGIRSIPTLLFIPVNGEPQMVTGALPKPNLKQAISDILHVK